MENYHTILTRIKGSLATITLNRPEVHHAINLQMIREITQAVGKLSDREETRIILINSSGKHFSSGADLEWMREGLKQERNQIKEESAELAQLFRVISETDLLIVAAVQGKVIGGANGLVCAADLVIAELTARFAFSEVKLGLIPATIAPYVLRKASRGRTSELMLSGRIFSAEEARDYGLVNYICEAGTLQQNCDRLLLQLLAGGPGAMKGIKRLLRYLDHEQDADKKQDFTADLIARNRISPEGQEGMNAFFEKRKPFWHEDL